MAKQHFLKLELLVGSRRTPVVAKVGFPHQYKRDQHHWVCSFQLAGLKRARVGIAHGVDGLQALLNATTAIRNSLARLKRVQSLGEPYEFVFPKIVPASYGLQFHRQACALLTKAVAREEKRLPKKRPARRKLQ
jgi:uncharacterized protein DUF6968